MVETDDSDDDPSLVRRLFEAMRRLATRIGTRLLVVHLLVVLVPVAGVEFARLYERRLLDALERDMGNQATLVAELVRLDGLRGHAIGDPEQTTLLERAAVTTRTRIRLLDRTGAVVADSHAHGPPEGPEPSLESESSLLDGATRELVSSRDVDGPRWPAVADRAEVRAALAGRGPATTTRYRARDPGVLLFLSLPVRIAGRVEGVVYVVRSTQPVVADLHRIREGLTKVLLIAVLATASITVLLALSISRPLSRLAASARRIARGERNVPVAVEGSGEVRDLAEAVATMTQKLEERVSYARDFAADVAHEFKSPLTSIRGAAELLAEGAMEDPAARERFLGNIVLDVDRLDRLVSRLLELGRIEASESTPVSVDLVALANDVARRCENPGVGVVVRASAPQAVTFARRSDVETALANVVENAVRFSKSGETVTIDVSSSAHAIDVDVEDHGAGIAPAHIPHVFDRFFTTDAERHGTGLGLAIVKSVLEAHGGRASVLRTGPGVGTVVRLRFPR